jgi:hypothetical protein
MKPIRWWLPALAAAALLAGCETARPPGAPVAVDTAAAEKAERDGEFVIAAREYERLAQALRAPQRQGFELRAAENLIRAGELREARRRLDQIRVDGLDPSLRARRQVLQARLLAADGAHEKAIRLLDEAVQARNLDPALLAEVFRVRAQSEAALDNPIGAVRNLIGREHYIVSREAIAENQLELWKVLGVLPRERLKTELNATRDPVLAGWIELALAAVDAGAHVAPALDAWKKTHPKHPAGDALLATIASPAPGLIGRIERVALLLPLSSNYAAAAQAVRDGFLAMDAANPGPDKPKVKVYDTGADPARASEVYQLAVQDGAQLVVGPLGREAADAIVKGTPLNVPTLLLSHTDLEPSGPGARGLFQFGLPPEQEARQAAERAWLDGHRHAALLYPQSAWGERMQGAFATHWQRLGGLVLAAVPYNEPDADHSEAIKKLLNIAQSEERKELLASALKQKIHFDPRPRQDVDMIFLAADARRARLVKPQLSFYRASRVPVYATSHVYTGRPDSRHDLDLDGVLFADMPWMLVNEGRLAELRQRLQGNWPHAHSDLDRLYALGVDSYAILPHLNRISSEPGARFNGVTSALSLERGGRLQRQLTWAQFSKGVPRPVDTLPAPRPGLAPEDGPGG